MKGREYMNRKKQCHGKHSNFISFLLVSLAIAALLSAPILARSDNAPEKKDAELQAAQAADAKAKESGPESGSAVEVAAARQGGSLKERERQGIRMSGLFGASGSDSVDSGGVMLRKENGKLQAELAPGQETKTQARIKLKDVSGEEIAELVAEFGPLTESEQARFEKGEASLRSIRSLRLVSKEKEVQVRDSEGNAHRIKAHVSVGLDSVNEESSLDIKTDNDLDEGIGKKFNETAKAAKIKLVKRGGVMEVNKTGLKNGVEVRNATITFKVEPGWVGEGNVNNVKVMRYDEGFSEVLPTRFAGVDEDGLLIFEGDSDKGLSTFGVFMVDTISEMDDTSFDWGRMKNFILPVLVLVSIGAMFVSSMLKKEHRR